MEEEEIRTIDQKGVCSLVYFLTGRKVISTRWVYQMKTDLSGFIERHKARLVEKWVLTKRWNRF